MKANLVEVSKIKLAPGDILALTIKSDDLDQTDLEGIRDHLKTLFKNNKVLVACVSTKDDLKYSVIKKTSKEKKNG